MPASRTITLSETEELELRKLKCNLSVPQRTRDRAEIILLSAHHMPVADISKYLEYSKQMILNTFHRWWLGGYTALFDLEHPGPKPRLNQEDIAQVETWLEDDSKTYTSKQLVKKLKDERGVELSRDRLRKILKKKDLAGSAPGTAVPNTVVQSKKPPK
jgi:transposase